MVIFKKNKYIIPYFLAFGLKLWPIIISIHI